MVYSVEIVLYFPHQLTNKESNNPKEEAET